MGRVHVAAVGSSVCGDVPDAGAYEHESAAGVGEATDDAGAASDLPVQSLDHIVRAQLDSVVRGELAQQVVRRLANALPETVGGGLQFLPGIHLAGHGLGLGQSRFARFLREDGLQCGRRPLPAA